MSDWRGKLIQFIRDDYLECRHDEHLDIEDSCLYRYLLAERESAIAVRMKRAFIDGSTTDDDRARIWGVAVDLLCEASDFDKYECVKGRVDARREDEESVQAYRKRIDAWLHEEAKSSIPDRFALIEGCLEIAERSRGKNKSELLLEYYADRKAGSGALEPGESCEYLLERIRQGASKRVAQCLAGCRPHVDNLEEALKALIAKDAEEWLYNVGAPVSGEALRRARVKDIPVDLVELCLTGSRALAGRLGIKSSATVTAGDVTKEEVDGLYRSVALGSDRSLVVPVTHDALSGMGLYVVGPGVAENSDGYVAKRMFDHGWAPARKDDMQPQVHLPAPFFAIVYPRADDEIVYFQEVEGGKSDKYDERARANLSQVDDRLGGTTFARFLWNSVVVAWVPRFDQKAAYAERALSRFKSYCADGSALEVFQNANVTAPDNCPGRFSPCFLGDKGF